MLSTSEVARRLGVKPETVYAYVSRGLLTSTPKPDGRGSVFDASEVDALAKRGRSRSPGTVAGADVVRTGITLIEADRYYYRGVDATELAAGYTYEQAAIWLWTGEMPPATGFESRPDAVTAARRAIAALPPSGGLLDALRVATAAAAVTDPVRFDLDEATVVATARTLIATLVEALPDTTAGADHGIAARLWRRLARVPAEEPWLDCLDAALVLLMDHDLAASTLAARVAASARANPYAVVSAALGALEGPLHGSASALAHKMLTDIQAAGSANVVVSDYLREGRRIPGLGHRLYRGEDPRARVLFERLAEIPVAAPVVELAREVERTMAPHRALHANVDLALAVLSVSSGMPPTAGECIFAIARTVGWIAHALEEYREHPLRFRPTGQYVGPRPPQPLPGLGQLA